MNVSLLDVLGPVMIGPSSSHTAGAARLARVAALIADRPFKKVNFGLSGSFARTGAGHGTFQALLAGALGLHEDDERIRSAEELAAKRGVAYSYEEIEMPDAHENSVRITFTHTEGGESFVEGSSVGGGRILITNIDGQTTSITAEQPTLLITQRDAKGVLSDITAVLAAADLNIAVLRLSREEKGQKAVTVIETDSPIPDAVPEQLLRQPNILSVRVIDLNREEGEEHGV